MTSVRDWTGRMLAELGRTDITKLTATGWTPPERFRVKAADGETDIYGVLYRPRGFDPAKRYPVVDTLHPGPRANRVAPSFDPGGTGLDAEPVAVLGFVVVALDGRGTPGRSKSFHDASYGRLADAGGPADHVAALRQLADTRPWTDLDRVGAFGRSGGGFAAVRFPVRELMGRAAARPPPRGHPPRPRVARRAVGLSVTEQPLQNRSGQLAGRCTGRCRTHPPTAGRVRPGCGSARNANTLTIGTGSRQG